MRVACLLIPEDMATEHQGCVSILCCIKAMLIIRDDIFPPLWGHFHTGSHWTEACILICLLLTLLIWQIMYQHTGFSVHILMIQNISLHRVKNHIRAKIEQRMSLFYITFSMNKTQDKYTITAYIRSSASSVSIYSWLRDEQPGFDYRHR